MKRSEMIKFMVKTWKSHCKEMGPDNAGVGNACSNLLDKMIEKGMQPPFSADAYYKTWRENGDCYTWEPEDEKE